MVCPSVSFMHVFIHAGTDDRLDFMHIHCISFCTYTSVHSALEFFLFKVDSSTET